MKVRADIADMLRNGATTTEVMTALHVAHGTVVKTREALDIPAPARNGRPLQPLADQFNANSEPVEGGHRRWTGYVYKGVPVLGRQGRHVSAYRVAFEVLHERKPIGNVKPGCDYPGCVAHVQDRPMREQLNAQFAAIFGSVG